MRRDARRYNFSRYPMLWIALAFSGGICFGRFDLLAARPAALLACVLCGGALLFLHRTAAAAGLLLAAFAFAGAFATVVETQSIRPDRIRHLIDSGEVATGVALEIEGVLSRPPELSPDGFALTLDAQRLSNTTQTVAASGRVRLFVRADPATARDLRYGSRVRAAAKLRRDEQFLNPGVIRQREILDQLQLDAFGSVRGPSAIEKLADTQGFSLAAMVYGQRSKAIDLIRQNLSPKAAGVMIASLLGNDQFLDRETGDLFREGGTYHLLVISGLHITVIGALVLLLLRRVSRNRWIHFGVTAAVLWAYALAVGGESPVTRAATMFTVLLFGYAVRRDASSINLLGLTALTLLVVRPSNLFSPSFQLTFVSVGTVFALIVPLLKLLRAIGSWSPTGEHPFPPNVPHWLRSFCEWLYWNPAEWADASRANIWSGALDKGPSAAGFVGSFGQRVLIYAFEAITASAILQIALLPMSVLYFHRISIVAVINNLWAGLVIGIESLLTVLAVVTSPASSNAAAGMFGLVEICNRLLFVTAPLERFGVLSFRVPEYSGAGRAVYAILAIALVGLVVLLHRWSPFELKRPAKGSRWAVGALTALLAVSAGMSVFHPFSSPIADGKLRIDFLDVGQGDSTLVTFPNRETMLIDAGGTPEFRDDTEDVVKFEADRRGIGEAVVSEYLWHRGYSKIDYVLATHGDADHIGGMPDVVKNFRIGTALVGRGDNAPATERLLGDFEQRRVPVQRLQAGDRFEIGGVQLDVLNPHADGVSGRRSTNDSSVVLRLKFRERVILMTGDIEEESERSLSTTPELIRADVVKVAHHGSKTSSTPQFVNGTRAELVVILVGRRSPYGHPHASVMERWQNAGTRVLSTGEHGTVTVVTNGVQIEAMTFLP